MIVNYPQQIANFIFDVVRQRHRERAGGRALVHAQDAPRFVRDLLASYGPDCDTIDTSGWRFDGYTPQADLAELVRTLVKEATA